MLPKEIADIVAGLIQRTRSRQIEWVSADDFGIASAGRDDYVTSTPEYSVNVYMDQDGDAHFSILNKSGDSIYHAGISADEPGFSAIHDLVELANRQSKGVDDALAYLRKHLGPTE